MSGQIETVKCTHVVAQVSVGFYDAEGNLVGEEMFPQSGENLIAAKIFHPHEEQLRTLVQHCTQQAWEKLVAEGRVAIPLSEGNGGANMLLLKEAISNQS